MQKCVGVLGVALAMEGKSKLSEIQICVVIVIFGGALGNCLILC